MTIDFDGEFGYELIYAVPMAYYFYLRGELELTISSKDTKCMYYFSPGHLEVYDKRESALGSKVQWHNASRFPMRVTNLPKMEWTPPPYREVYSNGRFIYDKPLMIFQNKSNLEWIGPGERPHHYFSMEFLRKILPLVAEKYHVIYNHPGMSDVPRDRGNIVSIGDEQIEIEIEEIETTQQIHRKNSDLTFNTLQFMLFANAELFVTLQGGNSIFGSYFGKKNLVYGRQGGPFGWEWRDDVYNRWYHRFSGTEIIHCDSYDKLEEAIKCEL
jgi:hypothetical protein